MLAYQPPKEYQMPRKRTSLNQHTVPPITLIGENLYGRLETPGIRTMLTGRRVREQKMAEVALVHRPKNGVYDPLTYYHILDMVMRIKPGHEFRTVELLTALRDHKSQFVWDAPTVGRILADIAETMHEAYGTQVLFQNKRWNGMSYYTDGHPERRAAFLRLLEDLHRLSRDVIDAELRGEAPKRIDSPLLTCASLTD